MKKKKSLTISHTVTGKNTLLFVSVVGNQGAIENMRWGWQKPEVIVKTKIWELYFDWKFPFIHRKEHSVGFWNLKGKI